MYAVKLLIHIYAWLLLKCVINIVYTIDFYQYNAFMDFYQNSFLSRE